MKDNEEVIPTADEWHEALAQRVGDIGSGSIANVQPLLVPKFQQEPDRMTYLIEGHPMYRHRLSTPSQAKRDAIRKKRKRSK